MLPHYWSQEAMLILDDQHKIIYTNDFAAFLLYENIVTPQKLRELFPFLFSTKAYLRPQFDPKISLTIQQKTQTFKLKYSTLQNQSDSADCTLICLVPDPENPNLDLTNNFLLEHQLKLQSIALDAAANGIMITDRHGRIQWVNPALLSMTGFSREEFIGQYPNMLKSGLHDSTLYNELWKTISSGNVWQGEITNRRKDGSFYVEEQTIAPVVDDMGRITNFIAIKSDISQRRELEIIQDDMIKTLVHDLRNPLNTILVSLEIAGGFQPEQELAEILQISLIGARRLLGMVNSLLDISKIESGMMPVNLEKVNIDEAINGVVQFQTPLTISKKISFYCSLQTDLPPSLVDKELFFRILQNLIDNAIKFSPHDSVITISANYGEDKKTIVIGVQDHGNGISPEVKPRLFQKFASSTQTQRATGLGLAFCKLAVEAMSGKIWVESTPDATTFLFSLPTT